MANAILTKVVSGTAFDIDIAACPTGNARHASFIFNSVGYPAAFIETSITVGGSAPTNGTTIDFYLLRQSDIGNRTDGANLVKSGWTPQNAPFLGSIVVSGVANMIYNMEFDTSVAGPIGEIWSVGLKNTIGQALGTNPATQSVRYIYYYPEVQ